MPYDIGPSTSATERIGSTRQLMSGDSHLLYLNGNYSREYEFILKYPHIPIQIEQRACAAEVQWCDQA